MKNFLQMTLNLILCGFLSAACNVSRDGSDLKVTAGNWGHLQNLNRTNPSKMYLSHVKKDDVYNICLAKYMVDKYPGIENELKAATNIWAYYIERDIKINITTADLPEAGYEDFDSDLLKKYSLLCPSGTHLVVGESYLEGPAVGETFPTYTYIGRDVKTFSRALFLKKPLEIGEEVSEEDEQDVVVWKSLAQATGKALSADEILDLMKKRQEMVYLTGNYELLTFKTIVHEFGHIWGLCDQYAINDSETNCDGNFSTINEEGHIILHDEAMMSKSSWITKLFLTDDDIEGIRQLAERQEFSHDWPKSETFRQIAIPKIITDKTIALAQINSAKLTSMKIEIDMSVATSKAFQLQARILDKNTESWIEFDTISFNGPVSYKSYTLEMGIGRYLNPEKVEVTFKGQSPENGEKVVLEAPVVRGNPSKTLGL